MKQVLELRVRDIKRRLVRYHDGYEADEVIHVLDKKELIQTLLAFEEHKLQQRELEQVKHKLMFLPMR